MDSGMAVRLGSRVDVAVVGGGSAGCVLAARLSEDRERSVCLIEAGPDYGPYDAGSWPADILDARALAFSHSWATDRDDRSQLRARILGGCSAHNACVLLEGAPSDYDWGPAGATASSSRTCAAPNASCGCATSGSTSSRPGTGCSRRTAAATCYSTR